MNQDQEARIIALYLAGTAGYKIANELNIKMHKIYKILEKHNITRSNKENSRKYYVNNSVFSSIDSEESAYWLGFLYADGYVTKENRVGMALSIKDEPHLNKFKTFLSCNYPIGHYLNKSYNNQYCRLVVKSEQMKLDLIGLGCLENKTLLLTFPTLREDLIRHFIRGYFDGDGSISYDSKSNQYKFRLCGTSSFLSSVLSFFNKTHKLTQRWPNRNVDNWQIDIGGNIQVLNMLNILYGNSNISLDRKYERFLKLQSLLSAKVE